MRAVTAFFAFVAAAATTVYALPNGDPTCCGNPPACPAPCPPTCPTGCLDGLTAKKIASTWLYFGVNIDRTLALELLAPNFTYFSDSQNLVGLSPNATAPGIPAFTNAFSFIRAMPTDQYSSGPLFPWGLRPVADPYIILDVFHSCDKIAVRWLYPFPNAPLTTPPTYTDIRGIDVIRIIPNHGGCGYQIAEVWSEFDNVAFLTAQGLCGQYCL